MKGIDGRRAEASNKSICVYGRVIVLRARQQLKGVRLRGTEVYVKVFRKRQHLDWVLKDEEEPGQEGKEVVGRGTSI